jgi:DNA-binding MarR family transcriptional regulator
MAEPFEELAGLDRLVHAPARLAILTALSACDTADFLFLQNLTGLSKGNLSANLTKLEEAKLVRVEKHIVGKQPRTVVYLTVKGHETIDLYWQRLEQVREAARHWQPEVKRSNQD